MLLCGLANQMYVILNHKHSEYKHCDTLKSVRKLFLLLLSNIYYNVRYEDKFTNIADINSSVAYSTLLSGGFHD